MKFIGRKNELDILDKAIANPDFSAVLLYGRRRVGKTELIRQGLSKTKGRIIPFCAGKTLYDTNFSSLVASVSQAYQLPLSFKTLPELLSFIGDHAKEEKTILVMDEYSYFRDDKGYVDSVFQSFIDNYQHQSHLTLILSGSIVRTMKSLIDGGAPLYGRFQSIIALEPFNYREASLFYPERTSEEKLFLYGCFGGIPHYLLMLDPALSVEQNLIALLFGVNGALKSEADNLLSDELSAIENASAVLSLIGDRSLHYSDINQRYPSSGNNGATYILKKLVAMGLLKKSVAINKKDEGNGTYEIADPFLRFYFAFYVPTRSLALLYTPEEVYRRFVEPRLKDQFLPLIFEEVARQFLIYQNRAGLMAEPLLAIGNYSYSLKDPTTQKWINAQFDVVTKDGKGLCDYECKFWNRPVTLKDVLAERESASKTHIHFYRIGFFSKSGFSDDVKGSPDFIGYTLNDLYR
jgi:AAA+ ATPase superfamily predicted ATPase